MRGGRIAYSEAELAFVAARYLLPRREIHAEFVRVFGRHDVTVDNIKALCSRRGWATREPWEPAEDALLREHFPHMPTKRVAEIIGRSESSVHQRATKLGLAKTAAYLASPECGRIQRGERRGVANQFTKGQVPANKGVRRGRGWAPGRMREGQFKPGQRSVNHMPVGSTRLIDGYEYTKVSDTPNVPYSVNWKATHILRWEAVHGPVPADHALKSLDGNPRNTDPSNWKAVPRAMLPRLNGRFGRGYDRAPAELKPTLMAVATLEHAVHARTRDRKRGAA